MLIPIGLFVSDIVACYRESSMVLYYYLIKLVKLEKGSSSLFLKNLYF